MGLQVATQWDALAHCHYAGAMYNGHPPAAVTPMGATKNGIDKMANGIVSRGVLLDIARLKGVERVAPGTAITPDDLEAAEVRQGVRVESGDVLLVRTGHMRAFTIEGDRVLYMKQMPGLSVRCASWLHAREVAAVASDTNMVEVYPPENMAVFFPLHMLALRDMGLTLGEMFRVTGGVGSPLNPLAIK
jgi:Putative cyclase